MDSREQEGKQEHIINYFNMNNIKYIRSKCLVGDYHYTHDTSVAVERKNSPVEIFGNLTKDHTRFRDECIRAKECGIKLVILIECEEVDCLENLHKYQMPTWKSTTFKTDKNGKKVMNHYKGQPVSRANPETMQKVLMTMREKYGIRVLFAKRLEFGKKIIQILDREI